MDGEWVRQFPALEFRTGNVVSGIDSLMLTHTEDEATLFNRENINTASDWEKLVSDSYGKSAPIHDAMREQYPAPDVADKFPNYKERVTAWIQDSCFVCNTRWIADAFPNRTWNAAYNRWPGYHGSDVVSTNFGSDGMFKTVFGLISPAYRDFAGELQSYFLSYVLKGDPNVLRAPRTVEWKKATVGERALENVLDAGDSWRLIEDLETSEEDCGFWVDVFGSLTNANGK